MEDIRVDEDGVLRCWKCGGKHFSEKRTGRAKLIGGTAGVLTLGIAGAAAPLLAKKKLCCQTCGQYNRMGNAQPFVEPGHTAQREARAQRRADAQAELRAARKADREAARKRGQEAARNMFR